MLRTPSTARGYVWGGGVMSEPARFLVGSVIYDTFEAAQQAAEQRAIDWCQGTRTEIRVPIYLYIGSVVIPAAPAVTKWEPSDG